MATCTCGKRRSKYATECLACAREHFKRLRAEGLAILATGKCPECGRQMVRNSSIAGWWQCSQFGAETHRADPTQPSCNWQIIIPQED